MAKIKRIPSIGRQIDTFVVLNQKDRISPSGPKNVFTDTGQKVYLDNGQAVVVTN
jgi:hypothetical protein